MTKIEIGHHVRHASGLTGIVYGLRGEGEGLFCHVVHDWREGEDRRKRPLAPAYYRKADLIVIGEGLVARHREQIAQQEARDRAIREDPELHAWDWSFEGPCYRAALIRSRYMARTGATAQWPPPKFKRKRRKPEPFVEYEN